MTPLSSTLQRPASTFLMPPSPSDGRRSGADYRPSIRKAQGHVPACLVNASVTYCNNDQIYAFGGFDQYTDEGAYAYISHYSSFKSNTNALHLLK